MVRFAQRIECDKPLCPRDCLCVFLLLFENSGEPLQRFRNPLPALFAKWHEPIIIEAGQKVVFIELRRGGEALDLPRAIVLGSCGSSAGHCRVKIYGVDRTAGVLPPSNRYMRRLQPISL